MLSRDLAGTPVLASMAPIESLDWRVFVEQPVAEVFAKLNASILRTGLLLLAGLVISALGALALARGMVRPIRTLSEGAQRIGEGNLDQKIEVRTGDELEALADRFNRMSSQLRESYAGLERKVEERTQELQNSLEQQTAISEILRVIVELADRRAAGARRRGRARGEPVPGARSRACCWSTATSSSRRRACGRTVRTRRWRPSAWSARSHVDLRPRGGRSRDDPLCRRAAAARQRVRRRADATCCASAAARSSRCRWCAKAAPTARSSWRDTSRGLFTPSQVALVQTFARQAAIAIDNVRLFNQTKEALDQQTAISEILRVISASPTDVQPVLDAVAERALKLCDARAIA